MERFFLVSVSHWHHVNSLQASSFLVSVACNEAVCSQLQSAEYQLPVFSHFLAWFFLVSFVWGQPQLAEYVQPHRRYTLFSHLVTGGYGSTSSLNGFALGFFLPVSASHSLKGVEGADDERRLWLRRGLNRHKSLPLRSLLISNLWHFYVVALKLPLEFRLNRLLTQQNQPNVSGSWGVQVTRVGLVQSKNSRCRSVACHTSAGFSFSKQVALFSSVYN